MEKQKIPQHERLISWGLGLVLVIIVVFIVILPTLTMNEDKPVLRKSGFPYLLPQECRILGDWVSLPADRIYEKIDGRDALFQDYFIQKLDFVSVLYNKKNYDIYVYVMKDPKGALGAFKEETPEKYKKLTLGKRSDLSAGVARVCQDNIYLVVLPLEKTNKGKDSVMLADTIIRGVR